MELTAALLGEANGEQSADAGIGISASLVPLAGPGAPVKPATYAGRRFQIERRWWGAGDEPEVTEAILIDNVPSQANRLEAALETLRGTLRLPELVLDLTGIGPLPPDVPARLSSFRFPHRQADAYLRDALLDGVPFGRSKLGEEVLSGTADRPESLLSWFPQALLFGFWQSHLGKKRSHAKLARSWVSEIVGFAPASSDTRQRGLKGDPLNLSIDEPVAYDGDDLLAGWELLEGSKKAGGSRQKETLAELGHGQVPVQEADAALAAVSFRAIEQHTTVSFAGLRRVRLGDGDVAGAARALLVALGIVAHVAAFDRAFSLRSGCDLRPHAPRWTWHGSAGDEELTPPSLEQAIELFRSCVSAAEKLGLPVGSAWAGEPVILQPSPELAKVIRATYPLAD